MSTPPLFATDVGTSTNSSQGCKDWPSLSRVEGHYAARAQLANDLKIRLTPPVQQESGLLAGGFGHQQQQQQQGQIFRFLAGLTAGRR